MIPIGLFITFAAKRDYSRFLKAQLILVYFNRYKGRKSLFFISKCSGRMIISFMDFLYKNGLYKNVCNVIRFCGRQKQRRHVQGNDIQDALSPSTAIVWFIYDETILYQNESLCLILGLDGYFIYFA